MNKNVGIPQDHIVKDIFIFFNSNDFKCFLNYILCSFMVHLHVIEFWVEDKCCSLKIFDLLTSYA
jgi:hypothetical protein